jgi:hypothetical protein
MSCKQKKWCGTLPIVLSAVCIMGVICLLSNRIARADEGGGDSEPREEATLNMTIYHGQYGSAVADNEETTKGATTVANLNDTDGDGTIDNTDNDVKTTSTTLSQAAAAGATKIKVASLNHFSKGTTILIEKADRSVWEVKHITAIDTATKEITLDTALANAYAVNDKAYKPEVDLMKLVIHKPTGPATVTLSFTGTSAQRAKVWERPTKETQVNLPKQYTVANMPAEGVTVWIEATNYSSALQDIGLKLAGPNSRDDFVKATAAWVEKTTRPANQGNNPWCTRQGNDGFPHNPVPDVGNDLPHLTKQSVIDYIDKDYPKYRAKDGSRYGHGFCARQSGIDQAYGGRILYELKVLPTNIETIGVTFDTTRQIQYYDYFITNGTGTVTLRGSKKFPWLETTPRDKEEPNDDSHSADEDNTPSDQLIYSWDGPRDSLVSGTKAFLCSRNTFKEWSRILLEGKAFSNTQNTAEGSRASGKNDWHCVYYLKRGSDGKYVEDNDDTSFNVPVFAGGTERGSIKVTLLANAETKGYIATYDATNNKWTLVQKPDNTSVSDVKAPGDGVKWTLAIGTKIKVEITQKGGTEYADGATYTFSVFKTGDANGKQNDTDVGPYTVTGNP